MIWAAKIIGTSLATTGSIGAGIRIGVVFGGPILGVSRNPSLRGQLFSYAILGFAFSRVVELFALMMAFLLESFNTEPPKPHPLCTTPIRSCDVCLAEGFQALINICSIPNVGYIYQLMGNGLIQLAATFSAITSDQIVQYCTSYVTLADARSVMIGLYAGILGDLSLTGSLACESFSAFVRTGTTVVAIYIPGQGILAPWLTQELATIGLPWSNELLQSLTNFVR